MHTADKLIIYLLIFPEHSPLLIFSSRTSTIQWPPCHIHPSGPSDIVCPICILVLDVSKHVNLTHAVNYPRAGLSVLILLVRHGRHSLSPIISCFVSPSHERRRTADPAPRNVTRLTKRPTVRGSALAALIYNSLR